MPRTPLVLAVILVAAAFAAAHAERPTEAPARPGSVPDVDRVPTVVLDVCKTGECAFEHIQAAVNAAPDGALVRIWPGLYLEEPSRAAPFLDPDAVREGVLPGGPAYYSYEHHIHHPNSQNLIAVVGKKDITLRGMGDDPGDVVIDVGFAKHVGIRGDRADGIVIQMLSVYHAYDHNVYVLDLDGFVIEDVISGYGYEYDFLAFAVDHGVIRRCVAFGAGDAGIYPGGTANTPGRHSVEVKECVSYHNVLGYSGTQGDYVWVHHNVFTDNGIGIVSDSETDHPNYPQKGSRFEHNAIYLNNFDYLDGDCSDGSCSDVRPTVFVGSILLPAGIGLFLASNNENVVRENDIWGHEAFGVWLASGQGIVIGPTSDPPAAPFTSTGNRFLDNRMHGAGADNRVDFGWDGLGIGNCWERNVRAGGGPATSDHPALPTCEVADAAGASASAPWAPNLLAQASLVYAPGPEGNHPICWYHGLTPCKGGATDADTGLPAAARNHPDGYVPRPDPGACGPSDDPTCWT